MSTHVAHQFGIIGDVHAQAEHLEAALWFFKRNGVHQLLCVGDVVDGPGVDGSNDAERCCQLLRAWNVATVKGNHDRWFLDNTMRDLPDITPREEVSETSIQWLQALPLTLSFETIAGPLLLCHGVGENDMKRLAPDDSAYDLECNVELQAVLRDNYFRFLVGGHTHRRMVRRMENLTAINAGTLLPLQHPRVATVDFERGCVQFHDFENGALIPNCKRIDFATL